MNRQHAKPPENPSDSDLLTALRAGHDWAAAEVSIRITPLVRHKLYAGLEWEDVRQQCLVNVLAALARARKVENLWGLIRKITICHVIDCNRRQQLTRTIFADGETDTDSGTPDRATRETRSAAAGRTSLPHDEALADRELFLYIYQRLARGCQELFYRLFIDGGSFEEVSTELGITRVNLRVRLKRCRDRAIEIRDTLDDV